MFKYVKYTGLDLSIKLKETDGSKASTLIQKKQWNPTFRGHHCLAKGQGIVHSDLPVIWGHK